MIDYSYDSLSRLIEADYNKGATVYDYGYDLAGNLVNYDGVNRTYNAANQMTNDGTNMLTYDNNGNLRTVGSDTYTLDRANRLLSVGNHSYVYDGLGNRVQQTVSSVVTDYLNDLQPALTKLLKQTTGVNMEQFVHAPRGIHAVDDGTDWNFYAIDSLGSVRAVVDDAATVQSSMSYDPYGNPLSAYGAGFGFTGEQTDVNGSVFLRARYYEPNLGVFSALDPMATPNRYAYVSGNPVNLKDATGLCPENPAFWDTGGWNCIRNAEWLAERTDEPIEYWMQFSNWELERRQTAMQLNWAWSSLGSFANFLSPTPAGFISRANTAINIADTINNSLGCVTDIAGWFFSSQTQSAIANEAITGLAQGVLNNSPEAQREVWGGVNDFVGYNSPDILLDLLFGAFVFDELNDINRVTRQLPFDENNQPFARVVLVLGEEGNAPYARDLATSHSDWLVYGSFYGEGNNAPQIVQEMNGNLVLLTNVDGRYLSDGNRTGSVPFDNIVFNGPRFDDPPTNWRTATADMIQDVTASSYQVLNPDGSLRFSAGGNQPGAWALEDMLRHRRGRETPFYQSVTRIRFLDDPDFGLSSYTHFQTGGANLPDTSTSNLYWYIFTNAYHNQ